MADSRALLHLTQGLLEVLQEDEQQQQWRNTVAALSMGMPGPAAMMGMPPGMGVMMGMAASMGTRPMRPMVMERPPPSMFPSGPQQMIAGPGPLMFPMAPPMTRPGATATPKVEEPPDSPHPPGPAGQVSTCPGPATAPAVKAASPATSPQSAGPAAGPSATTEDAPSDVGASLAAESARSSPPPIRVARYAAKSCPTSTSTPGLAPTAVKASAPKAPSPGAETGGA